MTEGDRPGGRWERRDRLFRAALELPIEERADTSLLAPLDTSLTKARLGEPTTAEPDTIGPYRVLRRFGRGAMGIVYLADDPRLGRKVALKVLPPWLIADEASRIRLTAEARAASALDHPNVETVYDVGETDEGLPDIAMAYYPGETLAQRLRQAPLETGEAAELAVSGDSVGAGRALAGLELESADVGAVEEAVAASRRLSDRPPPGER